MNIIKNSQALSLATITFGGQTARWRTEAMRSHDTPRLIHITKGQGRVTVAGLTNGYGPNNLIFIPAHTVYGIEIGPTVFAQILSLPDTMPDLPQTPFHLRLLDGPSQQELQKLMEAIERELQPNGDDRAAACHLGLLSIFIERQLAERGTLAKDSRRDSAAGRLVARYSTLIAQHFQSDRSVADYARELGVTPTHLTRCCSQTCDRTALALLNERIHFEACTLLRDTRIPVQKVAQDLGFHSAAYFSRSFHEKTGQTPSGFRKLQQGAARAN